MCTSCFLSQQANAVVRKVLDMNNVEEFLRSRGPLRQLWCLRFIFSELIIHGRLLRGFRCGLKPATSEVQR